MGIWGGEIQRGTGSRLCPLEVGGGGPCGYRRTEAEAASAMEAQGVESGCALGGLDLVPVVGVWSRAGRVVVEGNLSRLMKAEQGFSGITVGEGPPGWREG